MNGKCRHCGSYAINPLSRGRDGVSDPDLCDVCYWRKRADGRLLTLQVIKKVIAQGATFEEITDIIDRELAERRDGIGLGK